MPLSTREDALYKCSIRKVQLNSHYLDCGWYFHQWHELSIVSCVKWLPLWQRWDLSLMVVRSSISVGGVIAVVDVAVVVVAVVVVAVVVVAVVVMADVVVMTNVAVVAVIVRLIVSFVVAAVVVAVEIVIVVVVAFVVVVLVIVTLVVVLCDITTTRQSHFVTIALAISVVLATI